MRVSSQCTHATETRKGRRRRTGRRRTRKRKRKRSTQTSNGIEISDYHKPPLLLPPPLSSLFIDSLSFFYWASFSLPKQKPHTPSLHLIDSSCLPSARRTVRLRSLRTHAYTPISPEQTYYAFAHTRSYLGLDYSRPLTYSPPFQRPPWPRWLISHSDLTVLSHHFTTSYPDRVILLS